MVLSELDGESAGVVLNGRDVGDGLADTLVEEPLVGSLLDIDEVWGPLKSFQA